MNSITNRSFSGFDLKIIALATMLIDHIGAVILWRYMVATHQYDGWIETEYMLIRYIGRMAFPIYCFLLVEGFLHTKSVGKYILRLLLFAVISEVPFDLAFNNTIWQPGSSNVFFTLAVGLVLIWGVSFLEKGYEFWKEKKLDPFIGMLLVLAIGFLMVVPAAYVAEVMLGSDYGMAGVFAILTLYLLRNYRYIAYILATMILYILCGSSQIVALVLLYPLSMYDGTRGKPVNKWLFYGFYPAHLLLLVLISKGLGV